jgi:hypothetical protein
MRILATAIGPRHVQFDCVQRSIVAEQVEKFGAIFDPH